MATAEDRRRGEFPSTSADSSSIDISSARRLAALLRQRDAVFGLVTAALVLIGGVAAVLNAKHAREDRARTVVTHDLAVAVGRVDADLHAVEDDATRIASQVGARGAFVPSLAATTSAAASGVVFARPAATSFAVDGTAPFGATALDAVKPEFDLARDTSASRVLPSVPTTAGGTAMVIVAPAYRTDPTGIPAAIATTDQRRANVIGYVLVEVDTRAVSDRAGETGSSVSIAPVVPSATPGSLSVPVAGGEWTVSIAAAHPAALSAGEWALLALAILVAAGVVATAIWASRRRMAADRKAQAAEVRLRLLMSLAPLLQETLDLALVLPEIALRYRDGLDLAGIGFAVPVSPDVYRDLYQLGHVDHIEPGADPAVMLGEGRPAAIAMHRAGRTVGIVRVRPRRPLNHDEVEALRGAAEVATGAIASSQLFEQQDEAMRRLRELDELKTAFLSTASHELRTPVTAIKGFATLLDSTWGETPDDDQRMYASRILANATSLDVLVNDLLDLSRLERGRMPVPAEPVSLDALAAKVLDRLSVLFDHHHLERELGPTPLVLADNDGVERIVTNLVSNAVHYAPADTTVTVRTRAAGHGAELIVDDEGAGVPQAERTKVFSRFFRGTGDAVVRTRGTGIGLAVVKEYVDQVGGTVDVDQSPAGGARFRVWLPAADNGTGA